MWFFWFMMDGDPVSSGGGSGSPLPSAGSIENYQTFPLNSKLQRLI